ncbi:MAG: hypothetical protein R3287_15415, partial [Anderseniella sp.]|nr:hypothetical protein [Anderseniella sp.]
MLQKLPLRLLALVILLIGFHFPMASLGSENSSQVLFKNVNIFNGTEDRLYENHQVLVEGNLIKAISAGEIQTRDDANVIDGGGRTLMPGMIDAHTHLYLNIAGGVPNMEKATWEQIGSRSVHMAVNYLLD